VEDMYQRQALVRVSYDDFARFLRQQPYRLWEVQSQYLSTDLPVSPVTVDELMEAIIRNGDDTESVYVFNTASESGNPFEGADYSDWRAIPLVGEKELEQCIIRSPRSAEFLWFECSLDMASNEEPAILLYSNAG
jgi:hypothetical protein